MASPVPDSYSCESGGAIYAGRYGPESATSITLNDVADGYIFQRVGTSKTITVTGAYTGTAAYFQARAVPAGTAISNTDYPWTTIAVNPTGGAYSGQLTVAQGGWFNLQVRDGNDHAVNAVGSNKFGVGIRVALLGQSNMRNLSQSNVVYPLSDLKTRRYASSAWSHIGNYDATETFPPNTPSSTYGATYTSITPRGDGVVYFANYLRSGLDIPVATFEYAVSGSNIASWQPGTGANWTAFANALSAAGGDCEAAIWYQGEENANAGTSSASYQASLTNVLNGLRSATGRNASNFHFGVVALGPGTTYAAEGNMGVIRGAHVAFAAANDGVFLCTTSIDGAISDSIHINSAAQARQGKRYAKVLLSKLAGSVRNGPKIAGATRSGATITVNVQHSGGTALQDGGGGSGTSLQGFRVFDNGVAATISGTAIVGNTIVLTLSATPSGTVTMDYAMANCPFDTTPTASTIAYDNDTVAGDTLGLPLQPCGLMTVS